MVVVDSSVWIDYFNGRPSLQTDALDGLLGRRHVVVGDLILAEVLQGFRRDREPGPIVAITLRVMSTLRRFLCSSRGA